MRPNSAAFIGFILLISLGLPPIAVMALAASNDETELRERIIVMNSGRVLTGFATRNAGGWIVEQSNGRVQVPIDQVKLVADSLPDAYRKQRDSVIEPTPASHMALAQWCISYRLHHEARDELRKCLALDPDDAAARKLLRRLDDMLSPAAPPRRLTESAPPRTAEGFLVADVESLGGLSTEIGAAFTLRIQPLLMNKCGSASCHGSADRRETPEGFHLIPVRTVSNAHRIYTERNLAEVLRYIDLKDPSLSPMLTVPQGTHGGTASIFHGTAASSQIRMLRAWIKSVADEKQASEQEFASRPSIVAPRQLPVEGAVVQSQPASANGTGSRSDQSVNFPPQTPTAAAEANGSISKPAKDTSATAATPAVDPFDPDLFNRRFHAPARLPQ